MANASKGSSKRRIIRCTFQAESNTSSGKFFDFLSSSLEEKTPRELMQEASEVYWMPVHLFYQYRAGEITADQFRQRVLWAISQQEAWLNYCRRLTEIDPPPQVIHNQTIYMGASESSVIGEPPPPPTEPVLFAAPEDLSVESGTEEASVSADLVQLPKKSFNERRSQSMKPAFGGAFRQDDDD